MANNRDLVFARLVVSDDLDPDAVDPMVMDAPVFAGDTAPVNAAAILHDVVEDRVLFAVDQRLEHEVVFALAADKDVIGGQRLIDPVDQFQKRRIDGRIREFTRRLSQHQLTCAVFAGVAAAEQDIVPRPAEEEVRAATAIQRVIAFAAQKDVIAISAVDFVSAAIAVQRIIAAHPLDRVSAVTARQRVISDDKRFRPGRIGQRCAGAVVDQLVDLGGRQDVAFFVPAPNAEARQRAFKGVFQFLAIKAKDLRRVIVLGTRLTGAKDPRLFILQNVGFFVVAGTRVIAFDGRPVVVCDSDAIDKDLHAVRVEIDRDMGPVALGQNGVFRLPRSVMAAIARRKAQDQAAFVIVPQLEMPAIARVFLVFRQKDRAIRQILWLDPDRNCALGDRHRLVVLDIGKLILAVKAERPVTIGARHAAIRAEERLVLIKRVGFRGGSAARVIVGAFDPACEAVISQRARQARRFGCRCLRDQIIRAAALRDTAGRLNLVKLLKRIAGFLNLRRIARVDRFGAGKIRIVEVIFRRAGHWPQPAIFIPCVVAKDSFAANLGGFRVAYGEQRLSDVKNLLDNAIGDIGVGDDVIRFNLVAMNDDLADQVLIMRAAAAMLV